MALARKLATYDDLLALPEDARAELLAGEVIVQPSPTVRHQRINAKLGYRISGSFDDDDDDDARGPGGWWIVHDVDIRLTAHDVVRPDLSGWRRARVPLLPESRPVDAVPDWICEILSPSNAKRDRGYKSDLYATHGVGHYWIVDQVEGLLEAFVLRGGTWSRIGMYDDSQRHRIPPFDAVELSLRGLFKPPAPQT